MAALLFIVLCLMGAIGWCINLVGIIYQAMTLSAFSDITPFLILKLAGIPFFPLGAILGWVGIFT